MYMALAIAKYRSILRRIASKARNFILRNGAEMLANDSLLTTVSRAVSHQNVPLADFLVKTYPIARNHIRFNSSFDARPLAFRSAENLSSALAQSRHAILSSESLTKNRCLKTLDLLGPKLPQQSLALFFVQNHSAMDS